MCVGGGVCTEIIHVYKMLISYFVESSLLCGCGCTCVVSVHVYFGCVYVGMQLNMQVCECARGGQKSTSSVLW